MALNKSALLNGLGELQNNHLQEVRRLKKLVQEHAGGQAMHPGYTKALEGAQNCFLKALAQGAYSDADVEAEFEAMTGQQQLEHIAEQKLFLDELEQKVITRLMTSAADGEA